MQAKIKTSDGGCLPIKIYGRNLEARRIDIELPSAQIKSGILLACLNIQGVSNIIEHKVTRDHTETMLEAFGANLDISKVAAMVS